MEKNASEFTPPAPETWSRLRPGPPVTQHNPVTQKLLVIGKRREAAEAQLEQRLRRTATPAGS